MREAEQIAWRTVTRDKRVLSGTLLHLRVPGVQKTLCGQKIPGPSEVFDIGERVSGEECIRCIDRSWWVCTMDDGLQSGPFGLLEDALTVARQAFESPRSAVRYRKGVWTMEDNSENADTKTPQRWVIRRDDAGPAGVDYMLSFSRSVLGS